MRPEPNFLTERRSTRRADLAERVFATWAGIALVVSLAWLGFIVWAVVKVVSWLTAQ